MTIQDSDTATVAMSSGLRVTRCPGETTPNSLQTELTSILVQSHAGFLRYLQSRLGNRDEAEDVLQDFYLRVVIKAGQIRDSESVMGWLRRVLRSVLVDHVRRRSVMRKAQQQAVADLLATTATQEPEPDVVTCTCFYKFFPDLKAEYAEVLRRVDLADESPRDAAHALGITTGNVRVRLHRARKALKRSLEVSCSECRTRGCFSSRGAPLGWSRAERWCGLPRCNVSDPKPSYQ